ncbi:putative zinc knuckle domain protein (Byr3) [Aspergillus neoniger CBS 115656]|uniref:CCHC-type domain-containing protein n=1 Tax=Aspergillus neoniger (strain CBS 115656) TaxID=1448310 RepID=A0A318YFP2_ASPNB|nr:hypothetical protein BO87DRAFT_336460 [Aspergillus neoniger CBS 115656]PYH33196.1 hypothetical protein BO87DRAFT_336460 [Aspergillus neoniger CBS 115656]
MSFQAGGRGCFNCGDASHQARDCPKKGTPTCYNCGGQGHVSKSTSEFSISPSFDHIYIYLPLSCRDANKPIMQAVNAL